MAGHNQWSKVNPVHRTLDAKRGKRRGSGSIGGGDLGSRIAKGGYSTLARSILKRIAWAGSGVRILARTHLARTQGLARGTHSRNRLMPPLTRIPAGVPPRALEVPDKTMSAVTP